MTSPHPLAAWVERAQTDPPRRTIGESFPEPDEDDRDGRRRRRARALSRVRRSRATGTVSRVRYS